MQLTDAQILTIALAFIVPIAALIHSNSRVSDLKRDIESLKTDLKRDIESLKTDVGKQIDTGFDHMELLLQLHEAQHHHGKQG